MYIEIKGVNFKNKGAELMLNAIVQKVTSDFPEAKFVITPKKNAYLFSAQLGLYQKLSFKFKGVDVGLIVGRWIHPKIRNLFGLVTEKEIDIVLDASGLAYTSQWGVSAAKEAASQFSRMSKQGVKIIMLPQAFGPFNDRSIKKYVSLMFKHADLIFARDSQSFENCNQVIEDKNKLFQAPDFTNLIMGRELPQNKYFQDRICIIPNYRMIDKVESNNYLPLIIRSINYLKQKGKEVFILIHEGEDDLKLAENINNSVQFNIEIIKEIDPLRIKWIIGQSESIISSRFHGLVSALSQGKVALGTGWNHKYEMLFQDYGFTNGLLDLDVDESELNNRLDYLIQHEKRSRVEKIISEKAKEEKEKSAQMWDKVYKQIFI